MENMETIVKRILSEMKNDETRNIYEEDNINYLGFVCKTNEKMIKNIVGCPTAQSVKYIEEYNKIFITITNPDYPDETLAIPVDVNDTTDPILGNIVNGKGKIHVYLGDYEDRIIKGISILNSPISLQLLGNAFAKVKK